MKTAITVFVLVGTISALISEWNLHKKINKVKRTIENITDTDSAQWLSEESDLSVQICELEDLTEKLKAAAQDYKFRRNAEKERE